MHWAEYRSNSNKAKLHLGFNLNNGIPRKLFLTEGKGAERPFVSSIIEPGQTAVLDRGYQAHPLFDGWQKTGCHFVCRIKGNTHKEVQEEYPFPENSYIFSDAKVFDWHPGCQSNSTTGSTRWLYHWRQNLLDCHRPFWPDRRVSSIYLLASLGQREILCLVETASQCLSSFCQKQERVDGTNTLRSHHLSSPCHLLS